MSMHDPLLGNYPIPDDTVRVAHAAFPKGNLDLQLRDRFGMLDQNQQFAHRFAHDGQPALVPARRAWITVFQVIEGVGDRQAADNVRDRISWTYALGLPLADPGFDFSVLSALRSRLLAGEADTLLFDTVLTVCQEAGLLKARGKQRTDSTHGVAAIRDVHRLETGGETLRHALNGLAGQAPTWLRALAPPAWAERYRRRIEQFRLPKGKRARLQLTLTMGHVTMGHDGYHLLDALYAPAAPAELRTLPAVATLRRVWVQQFYRCTIPGSAGIRWRSREDQPPSAVLISSPYDGEARYKTKRETHWLGYKVHLTETGDDDRPI